MKRKKLLKRILGTILILAAIFAGIYIGGWICLFKCIVDIINAIKAGWIANDIAFALFKVVIGLPATEIIAFLTCLFGVNMFIDYDDIKFNYDDFFK